MVVLGENLAIAAEEDEGGVSGMEGRWLSSFASLCVSLSHWSRFDSFIAGYKYHTRTTRDWFVWVILDRGEDIAEEMVVVGD